MITKYLWSAVFWFVLVFFAIWAIGAISKAQEPNPWQATVTLDPNNANRPDCSGGIARPVVADDGVQVAHAAAEVQAAVFFCDSGMSFAVTQVGPPFVSFVSWDDDSLAHPDPNRCGSLYRGLTRVPAIGGGTLSNPVPCANIGLGRAQNGHGNFAVVGRMEAAHMVRCYEQYRDNGVSYAHGCDPASDAFYDWNTPWGTPLSTVTQ